MEGIQDKPTPGGASIPGQPGRHRVRDTRREMVNQAASVVLSSANQSELIADLRNQLNADLEGSLRPTLG